MAHTLDVSKLGMVFEGLEENTHKLTPWECDRLEEWKAWWESDHLLTDRQLEILEQMWQKV